MRRRMIVLAAAVVVLASMGGAALGYERAHRITEPNAQGVITACYDTRTGKIRMVNGGAHCAAGERKLAWRQHPKKPVVHVVGAPGEPAYSAFWRAYASPPFGDVSFYKDSSGIVHLTGLACRKSLGADPCISATIFAGSDVLFTLPPGFRPPAQQVFTTLSYGLGNYLHIRLDVTTTGDVEVVTPPSAGGDWISLDGISFLGG